MAKRSGCNSIQGSPFLSVRHASHRLPNTGRMDGSMATPVHHDGGMIGAAASLSKGDTQFLRGSGSVESDMVQIGAYASWSSGGAFVEAYGGIGQGDLLIAALRAAVDGTDPVTGQRMCSASRARRRRAHP